jgi:CRISPR-associated endonuclease/helicase Cas3
MTLHRRSDEATRRRGPVSARGALAKAFRRDFANLTGIPAPFAWQEELFARLVDSDIPQRIDLPTGAGKTSVMAIWLLALAAQAKQGAPDLPRRLVWVVDRRVVVDQATEEADRLANQLGAPALTDVATALAKLCYGLAPDDNPLAVSTLRGEREDNREWSANPTRPAVIVGTVDMIGSRLLFSGYGDSRRRRALHAGLLGQDALIVNDEAHLTPAFAALLAHLGGRTGGECPMRHVLLSATQRESGAGTFPVGLDADLCDPRSEFARRYRAVKRLHILPPAAKPRDEIGNLALKPDRRTLVFTRSPEDARSLAAAIEKENKGARVRLITGVQRGYERDKLLGDEIVRRFLSKDPPAADAPPCWIVATSAGEVGINLSSDRLITDLDTADHLLQRFGRLNRFGETKGEAHVIYSAKQLAGEQNQAGRLKATLGYLHSLRRDVSPAKLRQQPPPPEAMSREPNRAPLLPWLIDAWSLTCIDAGDWPGRPAVASWLHGEEEAAPPETHVAWRDDVADLAGNSISPTDLEDVFDCFPVLAHERLKQYTRKLCDDLREPGYKNSPAILISADGEIHASSLGQLLDDTERFRYATLLLPPGVGYLDDNGMVDWSKPTGNLTPEQLARYDVADNVPDPQRKRRHIRVAPGEREPDTGLRCRCRIEIPAATGEDATEESATWLYFSGPQRGQAKQAPQLLADHQQRVTAIAAELAQRLGFDERLVHVFAWAAEWHDTGKDRPVWQRAAGNHNGGPPLAKCGSLKARMLDGYRHELGSLLDARDRLPADFTPQERDLALHLIAAHHGWARPHFPKRAFDKIAFRRSGEAALETARRFGRLQRRYGAWGLAHLEAVFRSADAIASADAPELSANA